MKMKLLSPAGDFESLKMAVFYGADEVYLGVRDFNARNNIEGFDLNGLKKAVDFATAYEIFGCGQHLSHKFWSLQLKRRCRYFGESIERDI